MSTNLVANDAGTGLVQAMPAVQNNGQTIFGAAAILTPSNMSGDVNNYNPAGLATCSILRIATGGAARNITGLAAPANGSQMIVIINTDTSHAVTLKNASGSSSAGNQFQGTNGADVVIRSGGCCIVVYDPTGAVWVPVAI